MFSSFMINGWNLFTECYDTILLWPTSENDVSQLLSLTQPLSFLFFMSISVPLISSCIASLEVVLEKIVSRCSVKDEKAKKEILKLEARSGHLWKMLTFNKIMTWFLNFLCIPRGMWCNLNYILVHASNPLPPFHFFISMLFWKNWPK